jgi:hypothetical protein
MKMGFALAAIVARRPGMTGVAVTFVYHIQRKRHERGGQFITNSVGNRHLRNIPYAS